LPFVVFPNDTELKDALRDLYDFESLLVFRVGLEERAQAGSEFIDGLLTVASA
jgi:hypothetical protein